MLPAADQAGHSLPRRSDAVRSSSLPGSVQVSEEPGAGSISDPYESAGVRQGRVRRQGGAYVFGIAISEAAYLSLIARSGRTEQEWVAEVRPALDEASRTHPPLREASSARQEAHPRQIRDDDFAYGLERVLDGLAARLDA
ncbi:hypothetical protein [Streptomyces parvus]|uniref:hypothetical protein n=1 Tax=Streptomyces parvus TaxID=66428 RepID=UPI002101AEC4|nr:hypothetical protein [Streptomyces parvus]MCQ1581542.1 hypothetical protein [Streptomyces parvus]